MLFDEFNEKNERHFAAFCALAKQKWNADPLDTDAGFEKAIRSAAIEVNESIQAEDDAAEAVRRLQRPSLRPPSLLDQIEMTLRGNPALLVLLGGLVNELSHKFSRDTSYSDVCFTDEPRHSGRIRRVGNAIVAADRFESAVWAKDGSVAIQLRSRDGKEPNHELMSSVSTGEEPPSQADIDASIARATATREARPHMSIERALAMISQVAPFLSGNEFITSLLAKLGIHVESNVPEGMMKPEDLIDKVAVLRKADGKISVGLITGFDNGEFSCDRIDDDFGYLAMFPVAEVVEGEVEIYDTVEEALADTDHEKEEATDDGE